MSDSSYSFNLVNTYEGKNTASIYISNDSSYNTLQLTITNTSSEDIPFSANSSAFSLNFDRSLLTDDEFENMSIQATGWTAKYQSGRFRKWELMPNETTTLAAGSQLIFTFSNVVASQQPTTGYCDIDYGGDTTQLPMSLLNPPTNQKQDLQLEYGFSGLNTVFTTNTQEPILNNLAFYIGNPNPMNPLVASGSNWEDNPPVFIVAFVPGTQDGALTDLSNLQNIEITVQDESYANQWSINKTQNDQNNSCPVWELKPNQSNNHQILGDIENPPVTIDFSITNLVVDSRVGETLMYLTFANLPGYNDGYCATLIQKKSSL